MPEQRCVAASFVLPTTKPMHPERPLQPDGQAFEAGQKVNGQQGREWQPDQRMQPG